MAHRVVTSPDAVPFSDCIILVGSRHCGKTLLARYLCERPGYQLVSADEIYARDPTASIRTVASRVTKLLRAGAKVVLDDARSMSDTVQDAYISKVQELTKYTVTTVIMTPMGGARQCAWAHEWAIAAGAKGIEPVAFQSFNPEYDLNLLHEKARDCLVELRYGLLSIDHHPYTTPAVFIEFSALFTPHNDARSNLSWQPNNKVTDAIKAWMTRPGPRVVVVVVSEDVCTSRHPYLKSQRGQDNGIVLRSVRAALADVVRDHVLAFPLHYVIAASTDTSATKDTFFHPPYPGMIASAQYRHGIDLTASLYVSDGVGDDVAYLGAQCGVPSCRVGEFLRTVADAQTSTRQQYLNSKVKLPDYLASIHYLRLESRPVPLRNTVPAGASYHEVRVSDSRIHGVIPGGTGSVGSADPAVTTSNSEAVRTEKDKGRAIPPPPPPAAAAAPPPPGAPPPPSRAVTETEYLTALAAVPVALLESIFGPKIVKNSEQVAASRALQQPLVFTRDMRRLSAQCQGSGPGTLYDVSVVFRALDDLVPDGSPEDEERDGDGKVKYPYFEGFYCTCAWAKSHFGKCKHSCGLFLKWRSSTRRVTPIQPKAVGVAASPGKPSARVMNVSHASPALQPQTSDKAGPSNAGPSSAGPRRAVANRDTSGHPDPDVVMIQPEQHVECVERPEGRALPVWMMGGNKEAIGKAPPKKRRAKGKGKGKSDKKGKAPAKRQKTDDPPSPRSQARARARAKVAMLPHAYLNWRPGLPGNIRSGDDLLKYAQFILDRRSVSHTAQTAPVTQTSTASGQTATDATIPGATNNIHNLAPTPRAVTPVGGPKVTSLGAILRGETTRQTKG